MSEDLHVEIRRVLLNDAQVAALSAGRIAAGYAARDWNADAKDYIVYHNVSLDTICSLKEESGLFNAKVEFNCYGSSRTASSELCKAVKAVWKNWFKRQGLIRSVKPTEPTQDRDLPPVQGENSPIYCTSVTLSFWCRG